MLAHDGQFMAWLEVRSRERCARQVFPTQHAAKVWAALTAKKQGWLRRPGAKPTYIEQRLAQRRDKAARK